MGHGCRVLFSILIVLLPWQIEELEEGEIAASGDSHFEAQLSDGSAQEQEDGEEEHALQPSIKRKRSARQPRRRPLEKVGVSGVGLKVTERKPPPMYPPFPQLPLERPLHEVDRQFSSQMEQKINLPLKRLHGDSGGAMETLLKRADQSLPPAKRRHLAEPVLVKKPPESFSTQQPRSSLKHGRVPGFAEQYNVGVEPQKQSVKLISHISSPLSMSFTGRMPESTQKKVQASLLQYEVSFSVFHGCVHMY